MMSLDGPIGTYLIAHGVQPHRVWRAALDVPDLVVASHKAYLDAGARVVLTNTFALPSVVISEGLNDMAIAECVDTALDLALLAAEPDHSATIHVSLGPPGTNDVSLARSVMTRVMGCAAARIKRGRAVSVWLETLSAADGEWLKPVLATLSDVPFALSFMLTDAPPDDLLTLAQGAWACGCNCSAFNPKDAVRMQHALHAWAQAPLPRGCKRLAKPALAGTGDVVLPHAERLGFDLIGACCGGTVADISRLAGVEVLQ